MPAKFWKKIDQEKAQREADALRECAAAAADWQELYSGVNRAFAPGTLWGALEFHECPLRNWGPVHEDVWWSRANISKRRKELVEADPTGRYPGLSVWDGTGTPSNATLRTARLLFEVRGFGEKVGTAALLLALVRWHQENEHPLSGASDREHLSRAEAACRSVHPVVEDAYWWPGSRRFVPALGMKQYYYGASFADLIDRLAEDARLLCDRFVLVRIGSLLAQKSEAA